MATKDLHSNIAVKTALNTTAISAGGTTAGAIIDTLGYRSVEFIFQAGTLTSGAFAPSFIDGSASDLAGGAAVVAANLLGTIAGASFAKTDDNAAKRIGYIGHKRYVRASMVAANETAASGTATIASAVAGNKVTIAGHDFTAVANGATPSTNEWAVGAGAPADADSATALANAINSSATAGIVGVVTASANAAVVTITAVAKGTAGNAITLTKTGTPITVSGSGTLASGVDAVGTIGAVCVLGHPWTGPVAQ